jgi:hypothetical protein
MKSLIKGHGRETMLGISAVTEISTKNLRVGKERPACKADNLTAIYEPTV